MINLIPFVFWCSWYVLGDCYFYKQQTSWHPRQTHSCKPSHLMLQVVDSGLEIDQTKHVWEKKQWYAYVKSTKQCFLWRLTGRGPEIVVICTKHLAFCWSFQHNLHSIYPSTRYICVQCFMIYKIVFCACFFLALLWKPENSL